MIAGNEKRFITSIYQSNKIFVLKHVTHDTIMLVYMFFNLARKPAQY